MNYEIERKYLLNQKPVGLTDGVEIIQGYLNDKDPEIRLRKKGDKFFITRKSGIGIKREENEVEIPQEIFEILWPMTEEIRLRKIRYQFESDQDLIWEVDVYQDELEDLITAEVEFEDEDFQVEVPERIKKVLDREVTGEVEYTNRRLVSRR